MDVSKVRSLEPNLLRSWGLCTQVDSTAHNPPISSIRLTSSLWSLCILEFFVLFDLKFTDVSLNRDGDKDIDYIVSKDCRDTCWSLYDNLLHLWFGSSLTSCQQGLEDRIPREELDLCDGGWLHIITELFHLLGFMVQAIICEIKFKCSLDFKEQCWYL